MNGVVYFYLFVVLIENLHVGYVAIVSEIIFIVLLITCFFSPIDILKGAKCSNSLKVPSLKIYLALNLFSKFKIANFTAMYMHK